MPRLGVDDLLGFTLGSKIVAPLPQKISDLERSSSMRGVLGIGIGMMQRADLKASERLRQRIGPPRSLGVSRWRTSPHRDRPDRA